MSWASRPDGLELARLVPEYEAGFVHEDDCWSLARLTAAVERLAAGMTEVGVKSGDRVALHLRTGPEIATAYLACFRIGAIAAPLNLRFKQTELELVLQRLRARLYLGQRDLYRSVAGIDDAILPAGARFLVDGDEELAVRSWARLHSHNTDTGAPYEADPDAPAALLTTSGTTGEPKLVAHSLGTLTATADRFRHFGMRAGSKAAFFLPMVHMSGLSVFLAGLRLGVRLVMCDANDPAGVLDAVERHGLDCVFALPAAASALIEAQRQQPRNVSSLTMASTAGDVPPAGQQQAWEEAFGCRLGSFWAATEATGSFSPGAAPGPWSRPVPGAELRVVGRDGADARRGEVGEMLLRGTNVMLGYWRLPGVLTGL